LAFGRIRSNFPVAMARLAQLLAHHSRILLLDAASTRVTVGLLRDGQSTIWSTPEGEASLAVFSGTSEVLKKSGLRIEDVDAFLFCEGPGSMLGTRTIAMALRTWQTLKPRPAYAYQSLAVAARAEWKRQPRNFTVIADARRDTWHVQSIDAAGTLTPLQRKSPAELPSGERLTPANFRAWSELPAGTVECGYDIAAIMGHLTDADLFHLAANPDAFQHETPDYKKWSAQIHSAETAPRR
jgi:tRNA threonylcarbamoyladenosine biosynthesis protein TsaB